LAPPPVNPMITSPPAVIVTPTHGGGRWSTRVKRSRRATGPPSRSHPEPPP
jgi:hypothetical protein